MIIVITIQKHYHIGILLNCSGLTEIRKHWAVIRSLLYSTAQLRKRNDRHAQFSRKCLERTGNIRNFLLTGITLSASAHQLKVVDHDNSEIVFQLVFSTLRTHLCDTDSWCVIYDQIGTSDDIRPLYKLCPVLIFQITGTHILRVYMGFHR